MVARRDVPVRVGTEELRADFATQVKVLPSWDLGPALSHPDDVIADLAQALEG